MPPKSQFRGYPNLPPTRDRALERVSVARFQPGSPEIPYKPPPICTNSIFPARSAPSCTPRPREISRFYGGFTIASRTNPRPSVRRRPSAAPKPARPRPSSFDPRQLLPLQIAAAPRAGFTRHRSSNPPPALKSPPAPYFTHPPAPPKPDPSNPRFTSYRQKPPTRPITPRPGPSRRIFSLTEFSPRTVFPKNRRGG